MTVFPRPFEGDADTLRRPFSFFTGEALPSKISASLFRLDGTNILKNTCFSISLQIKFPSKRRLALLDLESATADAVISGHGCPQRSLLGSQESWKPSEGSCWSFQIYVSNKQTDDHARLESYLVVVGRSNTRSCDLTNLKSRSPDSFPCQFLVSTRYPSQKYCRSSRWNT